MADRTPLTDDARQVIRRAAALLTGHTRRQFQGEMAHRYCGGSARLAETTFGWGRQAVHTGLHELRSGILCVEHFPAKGRLPGEPLCPQLAADIREQAKADPTVLEISVDTKAKVVEGEYARGGNNVDGGGGRECGDRVGPRPAGDAEVDTLGILMVASGALTLLAAGSVL